MTDLSSIFRSKTFISPTSSSPKFQQHMNGFQTQTVYTPSPSHSPFLSQQPSYPPRSAESEITISSKAKKLITYNSLQNEVRWFDSQNRLECFLKSILIGVIGWALYMANWISWNTTFTTFFFVFLVMGLQHCIFGAKIFKYWACMSLFAANLIAVNQVFLSTVNIMNSSLAQSLYQTYHSLIPSTYISALLIIIVFSQSLLTQPSPATLLQSISKYFSNFYQMLKVVYKLKIALLQVYSISLIVTFIAAYSIHDDAQDIEQIFKDVMHPVVLLAQLITFWVFVIILDIIFRVLSGAFSRYAVTALYSTKNQSTKLPMILQLLRVSYEDIFGVYSNPKNFQQKEQSLLQKLFRSGSSVFIQTKYRKLNREQLQNIYKHSLSWLKDLIETNPNALNTPITTSRFYNTYYDILKEFTQAELRQHSNSLFQLYQSIENLTILRKKKKGLKEDLFYWFKVLGKQFIVWGKAVECCRLLSFMDLILQILTTADLNSQLWKSSSIGLTLNQIREKTTELSKNLQLNPIIRQKMEEYNHKTNKILRTQ